MPRKDPERKLTRLNRDLEQAILLIIKYVAHTTGTEPCQEEIAAVLKSYFTLDEVTNQINYLRKKPLENAGETVPSIRRHAHAMLGAAPSDQSIALSLKSSFILSELKNQIVHARNQLRNPD